MSELPMNQVICGDCLKIMPDWPDGSVDLVLTDPPYGYSHGNNDLIARRKTASGDATTGRSRAIANDGPEANLIFRAMLWEARRLLKPGCCCCSCCGGGGGPGPQFARWSLWMDEVFQFKQMVVWDKGPMGLGWHYRRSYETVLVGKVRGAACKWYGGRKAENVIRPGAYGIHKIIPKAEDHPTPKPLELAMHFINLHSKLGDVVLDPFAGHGWACVAAKMLGRRYVGIEICREYCRTARARLKAVDKRTRMNPVRAG